MSANLSGVVPVTQSQGVLKEFQHLAWKADSAARSLVEQFAATSQQMGQTLLMAGLAKIVVGRPAVVNQDARIIAAQAALRHTAVAMTVDGVDRGRGTDQAVQPAP